MEHLLPLFVTWDVNPALLHIGSFEIRYYGLLWAIALGISAYIFHNIMQREGLSEKTFDSIFWFGVISTVVGARLGHCLFYDPGYYLTHPIEILDIRQGGLASHGAAFGLLLGLWLFSRKNKMPLYLVARLHQYRRGDQRGGRPAGKPDELRNLWYRHIAAVGIYFRPRRRTLPKHPTQIYEALCYLVLFIILWWMYYKKDTARRRPGLMFGFFLIVLFGTRFLIEFIKNPQEDFEVNMLLNMGQLLSIPFILTGIVILWCALRKPPLDPAPLKKSFSSTPAKRK